jgi:hypothetical protein
LYRNHDSVLGVAGAVVLHRAQVRALTRRHAAPKWPNGNAALC